jgi:hypothetical protein
MPEGWEHWLERIRDLAERKASSGRKSRSDTRQSG